MGTTTKTETPETSATEQGGIRTVEEWLASKLEPYIAHELGYFLMIKILYPEDNIPCTGRLRYATNERVFQDPQTGRPLTRVTISGRGGKIGVSDKDYSRIETENPENHKLISISGLAAEVLLGLGSKDYANDLLEDVMKSGDTEPFGKEGNKEERDRDEIATYLNRAVAILKPYAGMISHVAQRMARDVAEFWGLGSYVLAISDKDVMRYLEGDIPVIKNQMVEKIAELYEEISRSSNPIKALENTMGSEEDPLPQSADKEWVRKMLDRLRDPNPEFSRMGNLGLTWFLMRCIPGLYKKLSALELDPKEFFNDCVYSIQETLSVARTLPSKDKRLDPYELYFRAYQNMNAHIENQVAKSFGTTTRSVPKLVESGKDYIRLARLYYLYHGKPPDITDTETLKTILDMADESGIPPRRISAFIDYKLNTTQIPITSDLEAKVTDVDTEEDWLAELYVEEIIIAVRESLAKLEKTNPRRAEVLRAYFGIGQELQTLEQIGTKYGISRERVRQIKKRALEVLAEPSEFPELSKVVKQ